MVSTSRLGMNFSTANLLPGKSSNEEPTMKSQPCSAKITSSPWHVADDMALSRQPEFIELRHLLADISLCRRKPQPTELLRVTSLADALNEKGFPDDEIRQAFRESLRNGRIAS
jgi:hypothetical protein